MSYSKNTFFEQIKASVLGNDSGIEAQASAEIDPHQRVLIRIGQVEYFDRNNDLAVDAMRKAEPTVVAGLKRIADDTNVLGKRYVSVENIDQEQRDADTVYTMTGAPQLSLVPETPADLQAMIDGVESMTAGSQQDSLDTQILETAAFNDGSDSEDDPSTAEIETLRERISAIAPGKADVGHGADVVNGIAA